MYYKMNSRHLYGVSNNEQAYSKPLPIYPSRVEFCFTNQVIAFLKRDTQELLRGNTSLRRLTTQSAASLRATLVQAAEEYADHHSLSVVSTRDGDCSSTLLSRLRRWRRANSKAYRYQSGQVNLTMRHLLIVLMLTTTTGCSWTTCMDNVTYLRTPWSISAKLDIDSKVIECR